MPFVQELLKGVQGVAGQSVGLSGSKTVTLGNTIVVVGVTDKSGGVLGITDNLGNTYTVRETTVSNTFSLRVWLATAPITTGGNLTSIFLTWSVSVTEKVGCSAEFSGSMDFVTNTEAEATSAAPSFASSSAAGLHLGSLGNFNAGVIHTLSALPAGWSQAASKADHGGTRGAYLLYIDGTGTGSTLTGTLTGADSWLTLSDDISIAPVPEGVSFDGLTFRQTAP